MCTSKIILNPIYNLSPRWLNCYFSPQIGCKLCSSGTQGMHASFGISVDRVFWICCTANCILVDVLSNLVLALYHLCHSSILWCFSVLRLSKRIAILDAHGQILLHLHSHKCILFGMEEGNISYATPLNFTLLWPGFDTSHLSIIFRLNSIPLQLYSTWCPVSI